MVFVGGFLRVDLGFVNSFGDVGVEKSGRRWAFKGEMSIYGLSAWRERENILFKNKSKY